MAPNNIKGGIKDARPSPLYGALAHFHALSALDFHAGTRECVLYIQFSGIKQDRVFSPGQGGRCAGLIPCIAFL